MIFKVKLVGILVLAVALQGCVAVAVGSAIAVATKTITDPRTLGTQINDTTLDSRTAGALKNDEQIKKEARIIATGYYGTVLLTGQAPNSELVGRAISIVKGVNGVERVYNEVRIGAKVSAGTITDDAWITGKIRSQLLVTKGIPSSSIKVVTENGEVFLLGIVSREEGRKAGIVASRVVGVKQVVKIFTFTD